jgi:hypothetical protein
MNARRNHRRLAVLNHALLLLVVVATVVVATWDKPIGSIAMQVFQVLTGMLFVAAITYVPLLMASRSRRAGIDTLQLLSDLRVAHRRPRKSNWMLPFRERIRQVSLLDARNELLAVIETTRDPQLWLLAIWLRGRMGGIDGTATVAQLAGVEDFQTRKEVVRALGRMGAWRELREMAKYDSHPRIRQLASVEPARPYGERLAAFASHAEHLETPAAKRRLFVAPEVDVRLGRPAKPIEVIRAILERIHRLVLGH